MERMRFVGYFAGMTKERVRFKPKVDKTLCVRVDQDSLDALDKLCRKWKCTRGEAVRRLIKSAR